GRNCGYIALMSGIAGGAEVIALPASELRPSDVAARLRAAYQRGKTHALAVIAEGAKCGVHELMEYYGAPRKDTGFALPVTRIVADQVLGELALRDTVHAPDVMAVHRAHLPRQPGERLDHERILRIDVEEMAHVALRVADAVLLAQPGRLAQRHVQGLFQLGE